MFGLGPASSAHHLLADHHNTALEGAAGLHLAGYTLTYTKEEIIIVCHMCLFNNSNTKSLDNVLYYLLCTTFVNQY